MLCLVCETNDCSENVHEIPLCESCATNYMTCENCGDPSPITAIETFMIPGEKKLHCVFCLPPDGLDKDQKNEWITRKYNAYEENLAMYRRMYGKVKPYYLLSFEILSDPDNVYSKFTVNKLFNLKSDLDYFMKIHGKGLVSKFRITLLDDLRDTELIDRFYSIVEKSNGRQRTRLSQVERQSGRKMNWRTDQGGCRILDVGEITHIIKRRPCILDWELTSYSGGVGVEPKMIDHNWFKLLREAKSYVEKKVKKGENSVISQ